jgi:hypothetical protein
MGVSLTATHPLFVATVVAPGGATARSSTIELGRCDNLGWWLKCPAPAGAISGSILFKWQGSKDGTTWTDLIGHARLSAAGSDLLIPFDLSLNFNDGNFGGNGNIISYSTYTSKDDFIMFQNPLLSARYISLFVTNSANAGSITIDSDLWVRVLGF